MKPKKEDKLKCCRLNEVGIVSRGRSRHRPRNDPELYGGPYPFFQTGDIKAAVYYLYDYSQTYNDKGLAQSKLWEPGTLCITIAANIAETAVLRIRGCFPDSVVGFVADPNKSDVGYIKYYIDSIKQQIQNISRGTTQDNLSLDKLLSFDFFLPEVNDQRWVASVLRAYDALIENNLRRIKILEEMARLIYQEWFINFRFPGHENARFVNSPLGQIPEAWEVCRLSRLVNTQYGYTESAVNEEIGPKFLRGMDINKNPFIDWKTVHYCRITDEEMAKYELNAGDIVIIRMADPGKAGIVEKSIKSVFASYLIRLTPRSLSITPYYLFYFLLSDRYQDYAKAASTGTTRKSASAGILTGIDILLPDRGVLSLFEEQVGTIRTLLNNLIETNGKLGDTRDLLLPKLISGEIDVSDLDIDVNEEA